MSDLIKRLRLLGQIGGTAAHIIGNDAADEIERLRSDIVDLVNENEELVDENEQLQKNLEKHKRWLKE
jgi:regulator of replication initiation timing